MSIATRLEKLEQRMGTRLPEVVITIGFDKSAVQLADELRVCEERIARAHAEGRRVVRVYIGPGLPARVAP